MAVNPNMIPAAINVPGTTVTGSRNPVPTAGSAPVSSDTSGSAPVPSGTSGSSFVAGLIGVTDVLMYGRASTSVLPTNPLSSLLKSGNTSMAGSLGISLPNDRIALDRNSAIQLATVAAQRQYVASELRSAQNAASQGDVQAQVRVKELTQKQGQLDIRSLLLTADGSQANAAEVRTKYLAQYPQATGFEALLAPGHDVLADLAVAKTSAQRSAMSARLTTALGVGVAQLDSLRAKIQYYQYLVQNGQITPEQQAKLDSLTSRLAGTTEQVEELKNARAGFVVDNKAELGKLEVKRDQTEKQVVRLVEANARLTGKSMVDGRTVDWSTLSDEQKVAELRGSVETVRTINEQVVSQNDFSAWKPIEQARTVNWNSYTVAYQAHHNEWAAEALGFERRQEDRHRQDVQCDERRSQEKRYEQKHDERVSDRKIDEARAVEASSQRRAQHSQTAFQDFIAAIDQAHAQALSMTQPAPQQAQAS